MYLSQIKGFAKNYHIFNKLFYFLERPNLFYNIKFSKKEYDISKYMIINNLNNY